MKTQELIFKSNQNKETIKMFIELKKSRNVINNFIEDCVTEIEVALRLRRMTKEEAEQLLDVQDDIRDLYI